MKLRILHPTFSKEEEISFYLLISLLHSRKTTFSSLSISAPAKTTFSTSKNFILLIMQCRPSAPASAHSAFQHQHRAHISQVYDASLQLSFFQ
jgi:hypothetical protein